jgi:hypothetical protein
MEDFFDGMGILERYYEQLEKKGLSRSTIRQHKQSISRFMRWFHTMTELKNGDLFGWQKVIRKDIRQYRGTY